MDDLISRADAIRIASGYCHFTNIPQELAKLPSADKTGHWIEQDGFDGDIYYDCSECGKSWVLIDGTPWENGMKFCPNCGARMKGEQE